MRRLARPARWRRRGGAPACRPTRGCCRSRLAVLWRRHSGERQRLQRRLQRAPRLARPRGAAALLQPGQDRLCGSCVQVRLARVHGALTCTATRRRRARSRASLVTSLFAVAAAPASFSAPTAPIVPLLGGASLGRSSGAPRLREPPAPKSPPPLSFLYVSIFWNFS